MAVQLTRRRFSVDDYYAMLRAGILAEDDRVELLDGEIVVMPPIGPEHAETVEDVCDRLSQRLGDRVRVRSQNPVHLGQFDEPEPDLAVVRRRPEGYRAHHPGPSDIILLIEVADTSLSTDRAIKMPLYARAGIPEAWIIDLRQERVLVHREPTPEGYRLISSARRGERLSPLAFPDCELAVDDLLG